MEQQVNLTEIAGHCLDADQQCDERGVTACVVVPTTGRRSREQTVCLGAETPNEEVVMVRAL